MKFYGVHRGRKTGVFMTWSKVESLVKGYPDAAYKSFIKPSDAQYFVEHGEVQNSNNTANKVAVKPSKSSSSNIVKVKISDVFKKKTNTQYGEHNNSIGATGATTIENLRDQYIQALENKHGAGDGSILYVYTDGSTQNNGRSNATGGYGVFFSDYTHLESISKPILGDKVTNNIAELTALLEAFKVIAKVRDEYKQCFVYTDSKYSLQSLTEWCHKWETNGWTTVNRRTGQTNSIKNKKLIQETLAAFRATQCNIVHINSHTGKTDLHSLGNEIADKLAGAGERKR